MVCYHVIRLKIIGIFPVESSRYEIIEVILVGDRFTRLKGIYLKFVLCRRALRLKSEERDMLICYYNGIPGITEHALSYEKRLLVEKNYMCSIADSDF
jgi:hypothetical protein